MWERISHSMVNGQTRINTFYMHAFENRILNKQPANRYKLTLVFLCTGIVSYLIITWTYTSLYKSIPAQPPNAERMQFSSQGLIHKFLWLQWQPRRLSDSSFWHGLQASEEEHIGLIFPKKMQQCLHYKFTKSSEILEKTKQRVLFLELECQIKQPGLHYDSTLKFFPQIPPPV